MKKLLVLALVFWLAACDGNNEAAVTDAETPDEVIEDTLAAPPDEGITDTGTLLDTITGATPTDAEDAQLLQAISDVQKALATNDAALLNQYINPKWGVVLVDRPGAMDRMRLVKNLRDINKMLYAAREQLKNLQCPPIKGMPPEDFCDEPEGEKGNRCLYHFPEKYDRLTQLRDALDKYATAENVSQEVRDVIAKMEPHVEVHVAMLLPIGSSLDFARVNGKWYLAVLDVARYSCSA